MMKTSKAGGQDGLLPESLRFARLRDARRRFQLRSDTARALAAIFKKIAAEGGADEDFVRATITPILKSSRPGYTPDKRDPDVYRGIMMSNVMYKLLSLVIMSRMSHWATVNKLIGPQ